MNNEPSYKYRTPTNNEPSLVSASRITGTVKSSTPLSLLGFNLEDIVTEGTTPADPADLEKAIALLK